MNKTMKFVFDVPLKILIFILLLSFSYHFGKLLSHQGMTDTYDQFLTSLTGLINLDLLSIETGSFEKANFLMTLFPPFMYTFTVLLSGMTLSIILSIMMTYIYDRSPFFIKKSMKGMVLLIESTPDVILIFSIQLSFIWVFNQTGFFLFDPIAGVDEYAYALPIFSLSILPSVLMFQQLLLALEEEKMKPYIDFAQSKGLSFQSVWFHHLFRNLLLILSMNAKYFFWFGLSNLLVIEYLFNTNGYLRLLKILMAYPIYFILAIILLFLPFYLLFKLLSLTVSKITGVRGHFI